ncbi:translation elongation factor Ts [Patescibacteria group bacterium]
MTTTLEKIKKLRKLTKSGVMDCKKALSESNNDFAKAKKWLLKKGIKLAAKKQDRETNSGIIKSYIHADGRVGAMVKLVCETDFVARNDDFQKLAYELAMQIVAMKPKSVGELLKQDYIRNPKQKIEDLIKEAIGKIKENIKIADFKRLEV